MKRIVVCVTAVLALGACGKKGETDKAVDASAAAMPAAAKAPVSMTPPARKAGLWEQTISSGKMVQTSRICFSDELNKKMTLWGQQSGKSDCSEQSMTPTMGGWTFKSTCNLGSSGTIKSQGEARGDFGSHYTVNMKSSTTGAAAPQMNGEHAMTLEGTWKGPCPADFKPGDMELPGGMKINMLTMSQGGPTASGRPSAAQIAAMRQMMKKQMAADEAAKP